MSKLIQDEWTALLAREGLAPVCAAPTMSGADEEGVACPACGYVAPLEDGACADCGLQLEAPAPSGGCCGIR